MEYGWTEVSWIDRSPAPSPQAVFRQYLYLYFPPYAFRLPFLLYTKAFAPHPSFVMSAPPELLQQTFVELEAQTEWRFELESDENIAVRVSRTGSSWPKWSAITLSALFWLCMLQMKDIYRCAQLRDCDVSKLTYLSFMYCQHCSRDHCNSASHSRICLVVYHLPCQSPRCHCSTAEPTHPLVCVIPSYHTPAHPDHIPEL